MVVKNNTILPQLKSSTRLIDTHCHLDMGAYKDDLERVLTDCSAHGIDAVVTIGIDPTSSRDAVMLAAKYPMVWATVGVHPHDGANIKEEDFTEIETLIETRGKKIVGYGEIGLDYVKRYCDPALQREQFRTQLAIAKNHNLPVVIHDREAHDDILAILKEQGPFEHGGVMHCFSGDLKFAQKSLDLGFLISIPGIVTFTNAKALQEVAKHIPLTSMLVETDGPFLAPAPYRGKRNEPLYLLYTADKIAQLRDISLDEVAEATTINAQNLFNFSTPMEKNI